MKAEKPKCSSIDHIKIDAIIFCNICKVYLCNKCENFHSKIFQHHPVQDLKQEKVNFFSDICTEKNHFKNLKYFCKNHNKLCCAACITKIKDEENGQHKDCDVCLLNDMKPEKEKKFNENYTKLEKISNTLEQTTNQLKELYEKINKQKEEVILDIQKYFTKLRSALNEREDKLIEEVEQKFKNLFFDDDIVKECDKLPNNIKKCLDSGKEIKDKWNKENELSYVINCCIEFENNLNKIDEINQKIIKCNSNTIKISFEINEKNFEEKIKELGNIKENDEEENKEDIKSRKSSISKKSKRSKSISSLSDDKKSKDSRSSISKKSRRSKSISSLSDDEKSKSSRNSQKSKEKKRKWSD